MDASSCEGQSLSILNECGTDVPTEKIPRMRWLSTLAPKRLCLRMSVGGIARKVNFERGSTCAKGRPHAPRSDECT